MLIANQLGVKALQGRRLSLPLKEIKMNDIRNWNVVCAEMRKAWTEIHKIENKEEKKKAEKAMGIMANIIHKIHGCIPEK